MNSAFCTIINSFLSNISILTLFFCHTASQPPVFPLYSETGVAANPHKQICVNQ